MSTENSQLLKKLTICERLDVSVRCLENMVSSGRFPPGVAVGKYVYWTEKTLDAWIRREFGSQEGWRP